MKWASPSRVLAEPAWIRIESSTEKPLCVQSSIFLASRSLRSLRCRKNAITLWCEAAAHLLEIDLGEVEEAMLVVEASLEEQAVPVGMEPAKGARALEHEDTGGAQRPAGGLCHEVAHQAVDEAADLPVKPLVMAEEHAKDLG